MTESSLAIQRLGFLLPGRFFGGEGGRQHGPARMAMMLIVISNSTSVNPRLRRAMALMSVPEMVVTCGVHGLSSPSRDFLQKLVTLSSSAPSRS